MPARAKESAGRPPGRTRETPTVTSVPAGAVLEASVVVSAKPATSGSAIGAPTSEAGIEVDADCGTFVGWVVGVLFCPVELEVQP